MTAAVYSWLSEFGAYLLDLSGAGLVAAWVTGVLCLLGLVWSLVTVGGKLPGWTRDISSRFARWRAHIILRDGTIRHDQRAKDPAVWPILAVIATVGFAVLVVAIMYRCGFKGV